MPVFVLQPIVENAVKHGVARRADAGRLDISARIDHGSLELIVEDDGVGFSASQQEGVGLSNTRERLATMYGEAGRLTISVRRLVARGRVAASVSSTRMKAIRAAIVDDEPLARRGIRQLLEPHADVVITGEAGNGPDAVRLLRQVTPDLVFLDIQMPELGGFEVLEQIDAAARPVVVFVTAYDTFAVRAFDSHAVDYL